MCCVVSQNYYQTSIAGLKAARNKRCRLHRYIQQKLGGKAIISLYAGENSHSLQNFHSSRLPPHLVNVQKSSDSMEIMCSERACSFGVYDGNKSRTPVLVPSENTEVLLRPIDFVQTKLHSWQALLSVQQKFKMIFFFSCKQTVFKD